MPNSDKKIDHGRDITIDARGAQIAAKVWGPEDGQPVLSAHGWLDNAASFDRLAPLLEGFRIVAFDFPGHGLSAHRPPGVLYHIIDTVPLFFDIADALGWQTFSLLCHSMGAGAASLAAGAFPDRVERMVLIDGLGPFSGHGKGAAEQFRKALNERAILSTKSGRLYDSPQAASEIIAKLYRISASNADYLIRRGLKRVDTAGASSPKWQFSYDLRLRGATALYMTQQQVLSFFHQISAPSLLIRPDKGWPFDPELIDERIKAMKTLQVLDVSGGHHIHLENPERIAQTIQQFLSAGA